MILKKIFLAPVLVFIYQLSAKAVEYKNAEFDFYGHKVTIKYVNNLNDKRYESAVEQFIEGFDEEGTGSYYVHVVNQLRQTATNFGLDDVGRLFLINTFAETEFAHHHQNFRTVLKWKLLYYDSMDVMLCYNSKNIYLYGNLSFSPCGVTYLQKEGKTYTDLTFSTARKSVERVYEYVPRDAKKFRKSVIKFNALAYPRLNALTTSKTFDFTYGGKKYLFTADINESLVLYLKDLPVIELGSVYGNYGFSDDLKSTLIAQLKTATKGMSKYDALGFLLKFVQSIPYKTDQEYHGEERYSYCEETLYNDYADCEDKVVLYAALAKELLGVKSVALMYEKDEHVAIALDIPDKTAKYSFTYLGARYVAAEPSGTGFELGQVGFDLERITEVIELF